MEQDLKHAGIDYGARLAGTTAVAVLQDNALQVWQSSKGEDADAWLLKLIPELGAGTVMLDAPLSLPAVYRLHPTPPEADFFYRACDREVKAMSPMFIGGFTARAIRLTAQFASQGIRVMETYPSQLARLLFHPEEGYKNGKAPSTAFIQKLQSMLPFPIKSELLSWHQADALLAWYSGLRLSQGQAVQYGSAAEGLIVV
jgi:predicted nuclease with RNAse H fold